MKGFLLLALFCVLVSGQQVVTLTDSNFASLTSSGSDRWMVEFYAPWCGWCKKLEPTWNELAADAVPGLKIGKVDCDANSKTCQEIGVRGFPTLKLLADGKVYSFEGGDRSLSTLRQFCASEYLEAKEVKPSPFKSTGGGGGGGGKGSDLSSKTLVQTTADSIPILTDQTFEERTSSGRWLVAATAAWCGHCKSLQPSLEAMHAARDTLGFQTAKIDCEDDVAICRTLSVKSFPTLFVVQDGVAYRYQGDRSMESLKSFAGSDPENIAERVVLPSTSSGEKRVAKRSGVTLMDESNFDELLASDPWLVGYTCDSPQCRDMEKALFQVQKSYSVHLRVGLVDCKASAKLCKSQAANAPAAALIYRDRIFEYVDSSLTAKSFTEFVSESFKSAPTRTRKHIGFLRRLDWTTWNDVAALEDFARQHRYLIVFCFLFGLLVFGIFAGSAMSWSPKEVIRILQEQAKAARQAQEKSGASGGGGGASGKQYLTKKKN